MSLRRFLPLSFFFSQFISSYVIYRVAREPSKVQCVTSSLLLRPQSDDGNWDESYKDNSQLKKIRLISYGLQNRSPPSIRKALGSGSKSRVTVYVCENCGSEEVNWVGRCPTCKEWNSLRKYSVPRDGSDASKRASSSELQFRNSDSEWLLTNADSYGVTTRLTDISVNQSKERIKVERLPEFSNVIGGGLVPGSMTMIGGDPGVGKSTLLLQIAGYLSEQEKFQAIYISGEENISQVAARAHRLGIKTPNLFLLSETDIEVICNNVAAMQPTPTLVVIDSIQTMRYAKLPSSTGSVAQVRDCSAYLLRFAKAANISVIASGHVTKSGDIAGPKTVEHMVDTVLYLEGDSSNSYRLLRSVKNRYGSSYEIGIFEMTQKGLAEVSNPSILFTSTAFRSGNETVPDGTTISVVMEGTRPVICEIQALVVPSYALAPPKRAAEGISLQRLQLLIAVIQKRLKYTLSRHEIYVNIVGGFKLQENASDVAIAMSIVSSLTSIPVKSETAFIGELGLGGELRMVPQLKRRVVELSKYGYTRIFVPMDRSDEMMEKLSYQEDKVEIIQARFLKTVIDLGLVRRPNTIKDKMKKVSKVEFPTAEMILSEGNKYLDNEAGQKTNFEC